MVTVGRRICAPTLTPFVVLSDSYTACCRKFPKQHRQTADYPTLIVSLTSVISSHLPFSNSPRIRSATAASRTADTHYAYMCSFLSVATKARAKKVKTVKTVMQTAGRRRYGQ